MVEFIDKPYAVTQFRSPRPHLVISCNESLTTPHNDEIMRYALPYQLDCLKQPHEVLVRLQIADEKNIGPLVRSRFLGKLCP